MRAAEADEEQEGQAVQLQPGLPARGQAHLRDLRGQGGRAALRGGLHLLILLLKVFNLVQSFRKLLASLFLAAIAPSVHLRVRGQVQQHGAAALLQAGGEDSGGSLRRQVRHLQPLGRGVLLFLCLNTTPSTRGSL